jgi:hypothetical protein
MPAQTEIDSFLAAYQSQNLYAFGLRLIPGPRPDLAAIVAAQSPLLPCRPVLLRAPHVVGSQVLSADMSVMIMRPLLLLADQTIAGIAFVRGSVPDDWYTMTPLPNGPQLVTFRDSGLLATLKVLITCVKGG